MRPNALALGAAWLWQKPDAEVIGAIDAVLNSVLTISTPIQGTRNISGEKHSLTD